jgi:hypothetical protein
MLDMLRIVCNSFNCLFNPIQLCNVKSIISRVYVSMSVSGAMK